MPHSPVLTLDAWLSFFVLFLTRHSSLYVNSLPSLPPNTLLLALRNSLFYCFALAHDCSHFSAIRRRSVTTIKYPSAWIPSSLVLDWCTFESEYSGRSSHILSANRFLERPRPRLESLRRYPDSHQRARVGCLHLGSRLLSGLQNLSCCESVASRPQLWFSP